MDRGFEWDDGAADARQCLVIVSVVQVRIMRMCVNHRRVAMPVSVGSAGRIERSVPMLVMRVVYMLMLVLHFLMGVVVVMRLLQVQINPCCHQYGRCRQCDGHGVVEQRHCHQCTDERRRRKIGRGASRSE